MRALWCIKRQIKNLNISFY